MELHEADIFIVADRNRIGIDRVGLPQVDRARILRAKILIGESATPKLAAVMVFVDARSIVALEAGVAFTAPPTLNGWADAPEDERGDAGEVQRLRSGAATELPNCRAPPVTVTEGAEMAAYIVCEPVKTRLGTVRLNGTLKMPPVLVNPT